MRVIVRRSLPIHPLKQGLKLNVMENVSSAVAPSLPIHPLKQGLKHPPKLFLAKLFLLLHLITPYTTHISTLTHISPYSCPPLINP